MLPRLSPLSQDIKQLQHLIVAVLYKGQSVQICPRLCKIIKMLLILSKVTVKGLPANILMRIVLEAIAGILWSHSGSQKMCGWCKM